MTPHPQPSHCRIVPEPLELATEAWELGTGDVVGLGLSKEGVFLSLDDVGKTLPTSAGEVGLPTGELSPAEARFLAGRLLRFASAAEIRARRESC